MVRATALVRSRLVAGVEDGEALRVEPFVGARRRDRQRLAVVDAIAQKAVDDLQEKRPFAQPGRETCEAGALARRLILRQTAGEQGQRLAALHRVDFLPQGLGRQDAVDPGRDEADAVPAALQERLQILRAPDVVDDHEDPAVAERLAELRRRRVDRLELRPLAGEQA